ncbi:MAG: hypothetical protein WCA89_06885 [Terracidiphilus sp.]|jgi:hypothetical protein
MFKKTAVQILVYALSMLAPLRLTAGPDRHVVPLSRLDDVGSACSITGKVKIELREIRVETTGPYGKPVPHRIFILFDPQSGAFSWIVTIEGSATDVSVQTTLFKSGRAAFLKDNSIFTFSSKMLTLYIQDPQGHASSMDEAEQTALSSTAEFNDPPGNVDFARPPHKVQLTGLSLDFVSRPGSAALEMDPKVTDVRWDGDKQHWIITLKARWTEEVTLDADYKLVSMKKVE